MNLLYLHIVVNKQIGIDRRVLMQISRCWMEVRANKKNLHRKEMGKRHCTLNDEELAPRIISLIVMRSSCGLYKVLSTWSWKTAIGFGWQQKISTFRYCFVHIRSNPDFYGFQVSLLHRFMKGLWNITRSSSKTRWAPSLVAYRTYPYCCGFAKERLQLCLTLTRQLTNYVLT